MAKVTTPRSSPRKPRTLASSKKSPPSDSASGEVVLRAKEGDKIHKTRAIKEYRVNNADLEDIDYGKAPSNHQRDMHLYSERDVELRAQQKYGGEVGFIETLKKKYSVWKAKPTDKRAATFELPFRYKTAVLGDEGFVCIISAPKGDEWLFGAFTPRTVRIKSKIVDRDDEWLWQKLAFGAKIAPRDRRGDPDTRVVRMQKVEQAWDDGFLSRERYPARPEPDAQMESSVTFRTLKSLLARGPTASQIQREFPDEHPASLQDWPRAYYRQVHEALADIIIEHGDEGWSTARWLVYDKHADKTLGIQYELDPDYDDPRDATGEWVDKSDFWLDSKAYKHMRASEHKEFCASLGVEL